MPRNPTIIKRMALAAWLLGISQMVPAAVLVTLSGDNLAPEAGGEPFAWTIVLNVNAASAGATNLTFSIPSEAILESVEFSGDTPGRWACEPPTPPSDGTMLCEAANLPANSVTSIVVRARYPDTAVSGNRTAAVRVISGGQVSTESETQSLGSSATVSVSRSEQNLANTSFIQSMQATVSGVGNVHNPPNLTANLRGGPIGIVFIETSGQLKDSCALNPISNVLTCRPDFLTAGVHSATVHYVIEDSMFRNSFE
ncbi:hypothetical protein C7S18_10055 [Ahniella affigens]|uniref:DUF11 domain-containing protein n=1 Tax=Ahniella affigens TaxID=2021234 RepID=A0A2P1PRN7_9GAMM|nr:hypothetical protein [Ahniella affigens]AVP97517.1 hypothetical protein C7S18_10055 [Ahniella affigens]